MKKIKLYDHEIKDLKEKIRALACDEIYSAKTSCYNGYASNEQEGDYGTWHDWFRLLSEYGDVILNLFVEEK